MNCEPYISVVIPLYNKQDYILRSVHSVLAQSYARFELIIVDDGSTDASRSRLTDCSDSRIRYVYQENRGEGAARNMGIRKARYDWIAFLDADDSWEEGFLAAIVDLIGLYPTSRLCATGYFIVSDVSKKAVNGLHEGRPQRVSNYFGLAYQDQLPFCASSVAIARTALENSGGFPEVEELGADQGMWCRLLLNDSFAFNSTPLATYHHDASGRICHQSVPAEELPFSKRLQHALDSGLVCDAQVEDARRYIAAHLLHLAKLNLQAHQWGRAFAFIRDERTRHLWVKRLTRIGQLYAAKLESFLNAVGGRLRQT